MTRRMVQSIAAGGLGEWSARDNSGPRRAGSPVTEATVDYVRRRGPVSVVDVAMRFGLTMTGAGRRLAAAARFGFIEETPEGWRAKA